MKVVAAALVMTGGRPAGRRCCQPFGGRGWRSWKSFTGIWVCAAGLAPGLGFGLGLAAGWGRGVVVGLGFCLAFGLGGCWVAGAGFGRAPCRPALPVAGRQDAGALAVAGLPAVRTG